MPALKEQVEKRIKSLEMEIVRRCNDFERITGLALDDFLSLERNEQNEVSGVRS